MSKREELNVSNFFSILRQMSEYDDRSVAIVGGAFAEFGLTELIEHSIESKNQHILEKTFGNKIIYAWKSELLSYREYMNLLYIKEVRNTFAHQLKIVRFDDIRVREKSKEHTLSSLGNLSDKETFKLITITLAIGLSIRSDFEEKKYQQEDVFAKFEKIARSLGSFIIDVANS